MSVKTAELLTLSGRFDEATAQWLLLVNQQPDNYRFHCGLQTAYLQLDATTSSNAMFALKRLELPSTALLLTDSQRASLRDLYKQNSFKSKSIHKIVLTLFNYRGSSDDAADVEFEVVLGLHMTSFLREGMPSLYNDISALLRTDFVEGQKPSSLFAVDAYDVQRHPVMILSQRLVDTYIANLKSFGTFNLPPTAGD